MKSNFKKIIKKHLKHLPKDDYPVLDTFKFVSIWLNFVLDSSQTSMRSLFKRLNIRGESVDISTFSKASKSRSPSVFHDLFNRLKMSLSPPLDSNDDKLALFPLDSTIVTLTSKLLWQDGYHQVNLFSGLNLLESSPEGIVIHFGQGHDSKYGQKTIESTPENGVGIMDRGFCSLLRISELQQDKSRYYLLRIRNDIRLQMLSDGHCLIGTGKKQVKARVIIFSDLKEKTEFRFATNLPEGGEAGISDDEIRDLYQKRWKIELLWKFLKMHLKLAQLITKNVNVIEIQIYCCLIAYLILNLVNIPVEFDCSLLDKLRYLQAFMCEKISYVHWFRELVPLH